MPLPTSFPDLAHHERDTAALLRTLRELADNPAVSQRQLAARVGLSLGKTHYVLHALLEKGLVKIKNFKRSHAKLSYAYILTPKGLREKGRLTKGFLLRKEAEFELLSATIAELRREVERERIRDVP
jgi:EPS-associated MarR family transcriptional regulator